jgi:effector-binding domain-containing protein
MRILKKIVLFVVVLVVLLAGIGMLLPRSVHVERSTSIGAPPATVFALVNGYRLFNKWSPWFALDPEAQYSYEGPDFGAGAKMAWASAKKDVGSGSQKIVESRPNEMVRTELDFGDQGLATAQFNLSREGEGTTVTWGLDADMGAGPIGRWFGLMMDRMVGKDYEKGLAGLKTLAESLPKTDFAGLVVEPVEVQPVTIVFVPASSATDDQAIVAAIGGAFEKVGMFMAKNGLRQDGAPITINTKWDASGYGFEAAIPVDRAPDKPVAAGSPVQIKQTYGGRALKVVHKGAYRGMEATYNQLLAWMAAYGYESAGSPWDEYVSDPGNTAEADLVTNILMPVK